MSSREATYLLPVIFTQPVTGTLERGMQLPVHFKTPTVNVGSILLGFPKGFLSFLWATPS